MVHPNRGGNHEYVGPNDGSELVVVGGRTNEERADTLGVLPGIRDFIIRSARGMGSADGAWRTASRGVALPVRLGIDLSE